MSSDFVGVDLESDDDSGVCNTKLPIKLGCAMDSIAMSRMAPDKRHSLL